MVLRDQEILSLCRARDQRAIAALAEKYGAYCHTVAHNILGDHPDAEECVNDAYLAVWNGVPSAPPRSLLAYLAKVTRNIALKRLDFRMDIFEAFTRGYLESAQRFLTPLEVSLLPCGFEFGKRS